MEIKMDDDKVLINFRITKARKRQLEYLAQKRRLNVTQFLDLTIFNEISNTLKKEAILDAVEQAALASGFDDNIAKNFRNFDGLENLKKIMDETKFKRLVDFFMELIVPCEAKYLKEFGLNDEKTEVDKILEAETE